MKTFCQIRTGGLGLAARGLLLVLVGSAPLGSIYGQVAPDPVQSDVMDQAAENPLQSQMAEPTSLSTLNENADTLKYSDSALIGGPMFFSVETTATGTTNLNDSFDDQPATAGAYFNIGVPFGIHLSTPVSDFVASARTDSTFYPGHTDLNHTSEIYSHLLTHQFSDTTSASWSLAGGHVVTLGHYLSPVIGIGTTGVVAPQEASGLEPLTDAATTLSMVHQSSERNTWTAAATGGWLAQPVLGATSGSSDTTYRQATGGGDLQWQHALNSREVAGVELNNVYVTGISPGGMSNFASVKLTFGQTLSPHSVLTGGIGPLYTHAEVPGTPSEDDLSYTANVGIDYRRQFGHINGSFARVYEIGYLAPSAVANEYYFGFDRPLSAKLYLTTDAQWVVSSAFEGRNSYSQFGFTTRLDWYVIHSVAYHVAGSSFIQDTGANTTGYHENEISTGISYYFGNPFSRAGVQ